MAAVLAADADLEARPARAPPFDRERHQAAHALHVEHLERVVLQDAALVVHRQELVLRILARERERRLRQVVGAEREELGDLGEVLRAHAGAHHLDHRAELAGHLDAVGHLDLVLHDRHVLADQVQFLRRADLRNHDFRMHLDPGPTQSAAASSTARICIV